MRSPSIVVLLLFSASLASAQGRPLPARPTEAPVPAATVEGAALNFIQWTDWRRTKPFYFIDPRRFSPALSPAPRLDNGDRAFRTSGEDVVYAPPEPDRALGLLASPGSFELETIPRTVACRQDPVVAGCFRNGRYTLLTLSQPTVQGDSASIEVLAYGQVQPTADAAAARTPAQQGGSAVHWIRMSLVRRDALWHVVANRWVGP